MIFQHFSRPAALKFKTPCEKINNGVSAGYEVHTVTNDNEKL